MDTAHFPSGRKVFYFFPSGPYHQHIVKRIIRDEFEIFTLSDYERGLPLIFQYNGAIIFFHIDELSEYNHIRGVLRDFCRQSSNRSIELIILTRDADRAEELRTFMKEMSNSRILLLEEEPEKSANELLELLNGFDARGQRRYVRFGSSKDEVAMIEFVHKSKKLSAGVHDISSAGLSFSIPNGPGLAIRSHIKDFDIEISERIEGLSGTVTIKRKLPDGSVLYVLMFEKGLSKDMREKLHTIIHGSLQRQFNKRLDSVAVP